MVADSPVRRATTARSFVVFLAAAAAIACAVLWAAGSASAQANTIGIDHTGAPPDINAGPLNVGPGGSATISVVTDPPAAGIGSWTVNVMYNPAVVTPTGCTAFGDSAACNLAFNSTQVRFNGIKVLGFVGVTDLADLTFQAIGQLGQCSDLTITTVTWTDVNGGNLNRPAESVGQICVGDVTPSPTQAPTPTNAPTATPSPTTAPTASPTTAPTGTATPTTAPTPTSAPTGTPVATDPPSATPSPTPSPTQAPTPTPSPSDNTCDGLPATIVGTKHRDWLFGTRGDDVIVALGGNDVVFGFSGNDHICLGDGNDAAYADGGDDRIFGEEGNDVIFGERGNDFMDGGNGWDWCFGGPGWDTAMNCKGGSWWRWGRWH